MMVWKSLCIFGGNELEEEEKKSRRLRAGLIIGLLNSLLSLFFFFDFPSLFQKNLLSPYARDLRLIHRV